MAIVSRVRAELALLRGLAVAFLTQASPAIWHARRSASAIATAAYEALRTYGHARRFLFAARRRNAR